MAPAPSSRPRSRSRSRHAAGGFFSHGSFAFVASQVVWLAAFFAGITALAAGVTYPQQSSAFVLPDTCGAELSDYNAIYMCCFAGLMLCILQACVASFAQCIMGSRKRLDAVPPWSSSWCRGLLFSAVFLCALSLASTVVAANLFVVVKAGRFRCQSPAVRLLIVITDVLAALVAVILFLAGSFVAFVCY